MTVGEPEPVKRPEPVLVSAEDKTVVTPTTDRKKTETEEDKLSDEGLGASSDEVSEGSQVGLIIEFSFSS